MFNKQVKRTKLFEFLANYPDATIAMEACSGSNYWGREFEMHQTVMLIPPQHVKPFVKGNKNDRNDAFAITEAARRPGIYTVKPRTIEQTDIMLIHKLRSRYVEQRTALINQLRGFLQEYGIVIAQGKEKIRAELPLLLEDGDNGLSAQARAVIHGIYTEWQELESSIKQQDVAIRIQAKKSEVAQRLMQVKGVAEKVSTALIAHIGDGKAFKNGRHFSANLGLVPQEHSSGGKQKLGTITKRGNEYIRRLLVQGAWSVLRNVETSDDRLSIWAKKLMERRGKHKAVVAVANKMARICWSMIYYQTDYRAI